MKNLTLKQKILAIAFVGIAGFAINLAYNFIVATKNTARLDMVQAVYFPILELADANIVRLDKIKDSLNNAVSAAELEILESADALSQETLISFDKIAQLAPAAVDDIGNVKRLFSNYYTSAHGISKNMIDGTADFSKVQVLMGKMTQKLEAYEAALNALREAGYARFTGTINDVDAGAKNALQFGLFISIAMILVLGITAFFIAGSISRNASAISAALSAIAQGDLTVRLEKHSNDEMGEMIAGYNLLAENLQTSIQSLSHTVQELNTSADDMSNVAENGAVIVDSQQQKTEQTATAMNEMAASAQEVSQHASHAAEVTQQANAEASKGQTDVQQTADSIKKLASRIEEVSNTIVVLDSETNNIGSVLDVIHGIADQTNLLALNAAIEAARAGDQGRGFAVVADEVRTLAKRTQESTNEIQSMIEQLQSGAKHAVSDISESKEQALSSVDLANHAGDSIGKIAEAVQAIREMNDQIASAAEQQNSVAQEINQSIIDINSQTVEVGEGMDRTSLAGRNLANLSNSLHDIVQQFRIS